MKSTTILSFLILISLLAFREYSTNIDELLLKYENAIENWEMLSHKNDISENDLIKINKINTELLNKINRINSNEWNENQKDKFLELSIKYSNIRKTINEKLIKYKVWGENGGK